MAKQKILGINMETSDLKWWRDLLIDLDVMLLFLVGVGWSLKGMIRSGEISNIIALLVFALFMVLLKRLAKKGFRDYFKGKNLSKQCIGLLLAAIVFSIAAFLVI